MTRSPLRSLPAWMTHRSRRRSAGVVLLLVFLAAPWIRGIAASAPPPDKPPKQTFQAHVVDAEGMETDVSNLRFYYEEEISETAFVPHELTYVPVKRGASTVKIKFDKISQIEVVSDLETGKPLLMITLENGQTGKFPLARHGTFKGESDFGEIELGIRGIKKIVFE